MGACSVLTNTCCSTGKHRNDALEFKRDSIFAEYGDLYIPNQIVICAMKGYLVRKSMISNVGIKANAVLNEKLTY